MENQEPDYSKMSQEQFDDTLDDIVWEHGLEYLYGLEGVWEIASEHFNDCVLSRWAEQHSELAYPEPEEEDEDDECEEQEESA